MLQLTQPDSFKFIHAFQVVRKIQPVLLVLMSTQDLRAFLAKETKTFGV
jgi:hypothetical protein